MEKKLIENGIKNLKEFGYPAVNETNIFTDMIYSQFFKRMLEETAKEALHIPASMRMQVINACSSLLKRITI